MLRREEDISVREPLVKDIIRKYSDGDNNDNHDEEIRENNIIRGIIPTDNVIEENEDMEAGVDDGNREDIKLQKLYEEVKELHKEMNVFKRPSLLVICILVFLFGFAEMLYLTPFITLTINKICTGLDIGSCDSKEVQMKVSQIGSMTLISSGIISTLMGGKWGQWSDQYGRVKVFAFMGTIRVIGNFIHLITLTPLVPYNKWLIILAATLNSTSGGMFAFFGNVNSYITDVVEPEDRISSMSIVNSLMQLTTGLGPLAGSLLVKWNHGNDAIPIYVAIGTGVLFTILCFTVIVEPRHHQILEFTRQQQLENNNNNNNSINFDNEIMRTATYWIRFQECSKHHLTRLIELLSPLRQLWLKDKPSTIRWNVIFLVTIDIIFMSVIMGIMPSFLLFCTYKYHWKSIELGYFISANGIISGITLFLSSHYGITILKKYFHTVSTHVDRLDKITIGMSMLFLTMSNFIMINFSNGTNIIIWFILLRSLARICSPVTEATIMKHYNKKTAKNTGQVFGAIALLNSLSMLVVPPILLRIYGSTISIKPELFLYFPLVCCLVALASCISLTTTRQQGQEGEPIP